MNEEKKPEQETAPEQPGPGEVPFEVWAREISAAVNLLCRDVAVLKARQRTETLVIRNGDLGALNQEILRLEKKGWSCAGIDTARDEFWCEYFAKMKRRKT
jgi:hypothetical protein